MNTKKNIVIIDTLPSDIIEEKFASYPKKGKFASYAKNGWAIDIVESYDQLIARKGQWEKDEHLPNGLIHYGLIFVNPKSLKESWKNFYEKIVPSLPDAQIVIMAASDEDWGITGTNITKVPSDHNDYWFFFSDQS